MECTVGELLIDVPAAGSEPFRAYVGRRGRPFLFVDGQSITVFDERGKRILFSNSAGSISYSTFVEAQSAVIENVASGADGTIDLRFTDVAGKPHKTEFPVGDKWLELVTRDGQKGTMLDGEFMSVPDARIRLEGRGGR